MYANIITSYIVLLCYGSRLTRFFGFVLTVVFKIFIYIFDLKYLQLTTIKNVIAISLK